MSDVRIEGGGTVYLFRLLTQAAREWVEEHVVGETTWMGDALAVEHRYAGALADGMLADGLVVE